MLAYHYTGIASVADIMRELALEHDLTVKQAELVCVHCVELSRGEILKRLGVSENTLKTRVRLLSRVLNANAGMHQVAVRVLRKAAQNEEARARARRASGSVAPQGRGLRESGSRAEAGTKGRPR